MSIIVRSTIALLLLTSAEARPLRAAMNRSAHATAAAAREIATVYAQQGAEVAGIVLDASTLRPIPGAQVQVEGSDRGTTTDGGGRFRLTGLQGSQVTLRIVMLGYRSLPRTLNVGTTDARILLEESVVALNEIVITGTPGAAQKRSLGNSIAEINAGRLVETQPITSVGELLQARVPGVAVESQMGVAGGGPRILIRGPGSLSFSGNPLVYVDGIRINSNPSTGPTFAQAGGAGTPAAVSRLNDINPADIERIEIIKGPAAATLYGSEASAGVIQIITKKGAQGPMRINARIRQGANWFYDAQDRMPTTFGINETTGQIESLTLDRLEQENGRPLFRTGHLQNYGVSLSGGSEAFRYYSGVEWMQDEGVIPENDDSNFNGRLNFSVTPRDDVSADVGFAMNVGETKLYHALYFGSIVYSTPSLLGTPNQGFLVAPARAWTDIYDYDQDINRYQATAAVNHQPTGWLSHRLRTGIDVTEQRFEILWPFVSPEYQVFFGRSFNRGGKTVQRTSSSFTTADYSATADFDLTGSIGSSTSVGGQYYNTFSRLEGISGTEFPAPGVTTVSGASLVSGSENFVEEVTVGLYGQQQFSWKDRLFLTAAVRADDHSAFGADFDLVYYPKFSASWVISEEPFWNIGLLNTFRLRAAYGESGQQPSTFAAIRTYAPIPGENDLPAGSPQAPGNPDLGPERGEEIEVGFDAALLQDRLGVNFTYYNKKTTDVILQRSVSPSGGFGGNQFINAGEISNKGFEATLDATPYRSESLSWNFTLGLSKNENEVVDLGIDAEFIPVGWIPNRHQVGFPVDAYFRQKIVSAELDAQGNPINVLCDGGTGKRGLEPGGAAVPCANAPLLYLGKPFHDWVGSFTTTLTLFQRLQLSGLLDFKYGGQLFESINFWNCNALLNHEIVFHPERFEPERVAECKLGLPYIGTSRIQDNGFTKLRELSLTYSLPERWAQRIGAYAASITVAGRNLYTWTDFDGLDPETFTPVNWLASAHTELTVPLPRSFMTTINLTF